MKRRYNKVPVYSLYSHGMASTYDRENEMHEDDQGRLHCEDGPALTLEDGSEYWYCHGHLHRVNGPAVSNSNGLEWWEKGKMHRTDGPASIFYNYKGEIEKHEYCILGVSMHTNKSFQNYSGMSDEAMLAMVLKYGGVS